MAREQEAEQAKLARLQAEMKAIKDNAGVRDDVENYLSVLIELFLSKQDPITKEQLESSLASNNLSFDNFVVYAELQSLKEPALAIEDSTSLVSSALQDDASVVRPEDVQGLPRLVEIFSKLGGEQLSQEGIQKLAELVVAQRARVAAASAVGEGAPSPAVRSSATASPTAGSEIASPAAAARSSAAGEGTPSPAARTAAASAVGEGAPSPAVRSAVTAAATERASTQPPTERSAVTEAGVTPTSAAPEVVAAAARVAAVENAT